MSEAVEEAESEGGGGQGAAPAGGGAAVALALGRTRGKARPDPVADDFLREQTRLARLQSEHLHEQRALVLSRLRWGRFSDRMRALLQIMTAVVGAAVVTLIATMAWQAHEAHGLVIEAFSVPPDLAHSGLTGQVAASRFLDKLRSLQTATANSDRPSQSYATDWGSDFKVEIPETGLTFSEFDKLLRERLGRVDHVTGEVVAVPDGIAVTARLGEEPPRTFTGPADSFDELVRKAAEAVYRTSQPFRYAEYLDLQHRWDEAFEVISDLAQNGPASERGWAYAKWSIMDLNDHGDIVAARRHAALGLGHGEGSDLLAGIARGATVVWAGHEEEDRLESPRLAAAAQKRLPGTSRFFFIENRLMSMAWLTFVEPDYAASGSWWMRTGAEDPDSEFAKMMPAMAATSFALGHDLASARKAMARSPAAAEADLAWEIAQSAFLALPGYWIPAEAGDWGAALADARAFDAALEAGKAQRPVYGLMQQTWIWPLEALARARTGDDAGAEALIRKTPLDCYLCIRVRGQVAAARRDWAAADRWFAEAIRQAPSLPQAHAEWARARLDRGDASGAIIEARAAEAKGARFADGPALWGEALMAQRDFKGAARKFAQADELAPRWGRNRLMWSRALALARAAQ